MDKTSNGGSSVMLAEWLRTHTALPRWATEPGWVSLPSFTIPPAAFAATSLCTREAAASRRCRSSLCPIASNQPSFYCLARQRSLAVRTPDPCRVMVYHTRSSVTLHPYCASALGNRTRWNHSLSFTIPPAWLRHAVPPLHKGGCGEPPLPFLSLPGCI